MRGDPDPFILLWKILKYRLGNFGVLNRSGSGYVMENFEKYLSGAVTELLRKQRKAPSTKNPKMSADDFILIKQINCD